MASTQRVLSGSQSKGSQAILVYPPSLSGTTAIDQYRQGINCRTMDHLYGFIGLKPAPINDPIKIVDGQRMETYRFYNDLDAPSNMALSSSRPESGSVEASFNTSTATVDTGIFSKNTNSAVGDAATTSNKWVVLGGSDTTRYLSTVGSHGGIRANSLQDKVTVKYRVIRGNTAGGSEGVITWTGGNMSNPPEADEDLQLQVRLDLDADTGGNQWSPIKIHSLSNTTAGVALSVTESLGSYGPGPWSVRWIQTNHSSGSADTWALTDISIEVNSPIREPKWGVKSLPQLDTSTRSSGLGVAINHARDQRDLGQAMYVYQDGREYNDLMTTNGADIVRTPPLNLVVPEMMVDASARSLMDGVMEVFPIRGLADRSSIELPYTARGIRADMCTEDVFRQSSLMDQQYDPNEKGVDMYFDGVETFGLDLLEPTFQAFNPQEDDETFADRLPVGATSTGPVTMQGLFAPRTNQLEPFKEGSDAYIRIAGITDEQIVNEHPATATVFIGGSDASSPISIVNLTVSSGTGASGMAEGERIIIRADWLNPHLGGYEMRKRTYRIVDEELSTVSTGTVLSADSDTGSATTANAGDIAVAIKVTGSSLDTQNPA